MNRRIFCLSSVAASISSAAAAYTAAPPSMASSPSVQLYKFVYDRRYPAGVAFGAAAAHLPASAGVVGFGGDITELWSRDLRLQWSQGCGAIAGMATSRT